jgi:predicted secreted protein
MTITAALVLFSVTWFMVLFCVLPVRFRSQAEEGTIVPGTPASAPADAMIGQKAKITTAISVVVFGLLYLIITSGWITVDNMDVFGIRPASFSSP